MLDYLNKNKQQISRNGMEYSNTHKSKQERQNFPADLKTPSDFNRFSDKNHISSKQVLRKSLHLKSTYVIRKGTPNHPEILLQNIKDDIDAELNGPKPYQNNFVYKSVDQLD